MVRKKILRNNIDLDFFVLRRLNIYNGGWFFSIIDLK